MPLGYLPPAELQAQYALAGRSGGWLNVVAVPPGPTFTPGNPRALFSLAGYRRARNRPQDDVSPDGQRFVLIRDRAKAGGRGVVYVENWFTELRAKVDGGKR